MAMGFNQGRQNILMEGPLTLKKMLKNEAYYAVVTTESIELFKKNVKKASHCFKLVDIQSCNRDTHHDQMSNVFRLTQQPPAGGPPGARGKTFTFIVTDEREGKKKDAAAHRLLCEKWVGKIVSACMGIFKVARLSQLSDTGAMAGASDDGSSPLQALFFKYHLSQKDSSDSLTQMQLREEFPDDASILRHLLATLLCENGGEFSSDWSCDQYDDGLRDIGYIPVSMADGDDAVGSTGGVAAGVRPHDGAAKIAQSTGKQDTDAPKLDKQGRYRAGTQLIRAADRPDWMRGKLDGNRAPQDTVADKLHASAQKSLEEHSNPLVNMCRSADFLRAVAHVFTSLDSEVHGIAIKVYWIVFRGTLLPQQVSRRFASYVKINCSGSRFSLPVLQALCNVLLMRFTLSGGNSDKFTAKGGSKVRALLDAQIGEVDWPLDGEFSRAFKGLTVLHHEAWPGLLLSLYRSHIDLRLIALKAVNAIINQSWHNAFSLVRCGPWQHWVLPMLTDLPRKDANEREKLAYQRCLMLFTSVHSQWFAFSPKFAHVIALSIDSLRIFSGFNDDSRLAAQHIFVTLVAHLIRTAPFPFKRGASAQGDVATMWNNVFKLAGLVRKFLFATKYWNNPVVFNTRERFAKANHLKSRPRTLSRQVGENGSGSSGSKAGRSKGLKRGEKLKNATLLKGFSGAITSEDLDKKHGGRNFTTYVAKDVDYGLHWTLEGDCGGISLAQKMFTLFEILGDAAKKHAGSIGVAANAKTGKTKDSHLVDLLAAETRFWKDTTELVETLHLDMIQLHKTLTQAKVDQYLLKWIRPWYYKGLYAIPSTCAPLHRTILARFKKDLFQTPDAYHSGTMVFERYAAQARSRREARKARSKKKERRNQLKRGTVPKGVVMSGNLGAMRTEGDYDSDDSDSGAVPQPPPALPSSDIAFAARKEAKAEKELHESADRIESPLPASQVEDDELVFGGKFDTDYSVDSGVAAATHTPPESEVGEPLVETMTPEEMEQQAGGGSQRLFRYSVGGFQDQQHEIVCGRGRMVASSLGTQHAATSDAEPVLYNNDESSLSPPPPPDTPYDELGHEVYEWCVIHRFEPYFPPFRQLGADSVEDLAMLTDQDLEKMGMKELHKRRFNNALAYMRRDSIA